MITEQDLQEAIAECEGTRNPNASTCIKLAAFYTIRDNMFPKPTYSYSFAPEPKTIETDNETEFKRAIQGRDYEEVIDIMDELMGVLNDIYPKLYNGVMDRLK